MTAPKMTLPTQLVLYVLMAEPDRERYGLEICSEAGLASGTIHPILARLEGCGWLRSRWEEIDPAVEGRPRRRYYQLDPNSIGLVRAALHRSAASAGALRQLRPDLLGGAQ
ncbi:PadR family transcriptional regulator [Amycolatopsis silviterrae]|uniref:PadR family transcriptional regulator n=1 Tax=Amycolatopsis silviterrae TaxID=1656914 RepID=A0ABW5HP35_9PSEU